MSRSGRRLLTLLLLPLLLTTLIILAQNAFAHAYKAGQLDILHPYLAPTPPGARMAAGYMVISNPGQLDDRLLGGTASFAQRIEVHRTTIEEGVAKMRRLDNGLELPVGSTVLLMPGETHLMFVGLGEQLVKGERYTATLHFQRAGKLDTEFVVEDIAEYHNIDHSKMHHDN